MVYILYILLSPICLGYVEDIFQTFLNASKEELVNAATELKDKTPPPMNVIVEKQSRVEALKKRKPGARWLCKMSLQPHQVLCYLIQNVWEYFRNSITNCSL